MSAKPFFWYELMTTDVAAAEAFYTAVVGWNSENWGGGDNPYVIVKAGPIGVGGLMGMPESASAMGMPPCWMGYIYSDDVDSTVESIKAAGGGVHREPSDIPQIGRFAVVADPHGAAFMLMKPQGPDNAEKLDPMAVGNVGWRELYAGELNAAWDFYSGQFGWSKGDTVDMGPMGPYQLFTTSPEQGGGMMTRPEEVPTPCWMFYFTIESIDAGAARVTEKGGKVLMGPMEVPGGSWVLQCMDPQGAMFALTAAGR